MSRDTGQQIPCFASHYNQKAIYSWLSFPFLYEYGVPLGGPAIVFKQRKSSS